MKNKTLFIVFLLSIVTFQIKAQSFEELVDAVFGPSNGSTIKTTSPSSIPPSVAIENSTTALPGTDSCTCIPYYLCNKKRDEGMIDLIVDEDPCESYLEVCCTKEDTLTTSTTSTTPTANRKGCGFRNQDGVGFHITSNNDSESEFGEFPWMVAVIHEQNGYQCGGALIHPQVVITAAHCVKAKEKKYKIRAGEWDTQTNIELYPHQEREVKTIVIHPEFYVRNLSNDIGMLILASPVDLAEHIQTVCLPPQDTAIDTGRCYITGWGKDVFDKEGKYSVILNRVDLPIVERNDCQKKLRTTRLGILFELHKSFICAGGDPERDRCKGDSGSPLVCPIPNSENRFYQMGIAAWSIGCGVNNIPGAYVNIPLFRNWIDDQMKLNNFDTNTYQY